MILETKNKKIELCYKTRKIVQLNKKMNQKSLEELYFDAMSKKDVEALSEIMFAFSEDKDSGLAVFKNVDEVYDFIDDYMSENSKTYGDIYKEIAEDINEQGFFNQKMTKEQLESKIAQHIAIDLNKIVTQSAEKAVVEIMKESPLTRG